MGGYYLAHDDTLEDNLRGEGADLRGGDGRRRSFGSGGSRRGGGGGVYPKEQQWKGLEMIFPLAASS